MYRIIGVSLKSQKPDCDRNFISIKNKIKMIIEKNKGKTFYFVLEDKNGNKLLKNYGPNNINKNLMDKKIPIIENDVKAKFNKEGTINILKQNNESLITKRSLMQLKKVRRKTKKIDIGDKLNFFNKNYANNLVYQKNILDHKILTYEDFIKNNYKRKNESLKYYTPGRKIDYELAEEIGDDLLNKLKKMRKEGKKITVSFFENFMKEHGATLELAYAVISYLVYKGFNFDINEE